MRIQIVEDDRCLSDGIVLALRDEGIEFVQSPSVHQAREDYGWREPELVILDVNLPDGSGYEYLEWLRKRSGIPVLVLTANDAEMDEVAGLNLGICQSPFICLCCGRASMRFAGVVWTDGGMCMRGIASALILRGFVSLRTGRKSV